MKKHMYKFIYILIALLTIIRPGPIVPIVCLLVAIGILIAKINAAKKSKETSKKLKTDIILILIVVIVCGVFSVIRISAETEHRKNSPITITRTMKASEFAEKAIDTYKKNNSSQFIEKGSHFSEIKKGFMAFLKDDLEIIDIQEDRNKLTCTVKKEEIIFEITKNNIEFSIK